MTTIILKKTLIAKFLVSVSVY